MDAKRCYGCGQVFYGRDCPNCGDGRDMRIIGPTGVGREEVVMSRCVRCGTFYTGKRCECGQKYAAGGQPVKSRNSDPDSCPVCGDERGSFDYWWRWCHECMAYLCPSHQLKKFEVVGPGGWLFGPKREWFYYCPIHQVCISDCQD